MDALTDAARLAAEIRNAAFMVRSYPRPLQRLQRAQAIARLGATVRHAFNSSDEFEPLLTALVEGLSKPADYQRPF